MIRQLLQICCLLQSSIIHAIYVDVSTAQAPPSAPPTNAAIQIDVIRDVFTNEPTSNPTNEPSNRPSIEPTNTQTFEPTNVPSIDPSTVPSIYPSITPTLSPSQEPSTFPSTTPSILPTVFPSNIPTKLPSNRPTFVPSIVPSIPPTFTLLPSMEPTPSEFYVRSSVTLNGISVGATREQQHQFRHLTMQFLENHLVLIHNDGSRIDINNSDSNNNEQPTNYSVNILNVQLVAQTVRGQTYFFGNDANANFVDENENAPMLSLNSENLVDNIIIHEALPSNNVLQSADWRTGAAWLVNFQTNGNPLPATRNFNNLLSERASDANNLQIQLVYSVTPYNPTSKFDYEGSAMYGLQHNIAGYQRVLFHEQSGSVVAAQNENGEGKDNESSNKIHSGRESSSSSSSSTNNNPVPYIMIAVVGVVCSIVTLAVIYDRRRTASIQNQGEEPPSSNSKEVRFDLEEQQHDDATCARETVLSDLTSSAQTANTLASQESSLFTIGSHDLGCFMPVQSIGEYEVEIVPAKQFTKGYLCGISSGLLKRSKSGADSVSVEERDGKIVMVV